MPKVAYIKKRFTPEVTKTITSANEIIASYEAQGFILTLRQLYYQFVSRGLVTNDTKSYKRLGEAINDGRLAGLIDWYAIEDRTRNLKSLSFWESPKSIIESAAAGYRIDKWKDQPNRIEVWIEKEALAGVFERVCHEMEVPFFSCRGYTSQSEMWSAGQRLKRICEGGQEPIILYFGDHDPSGVDMTRDIRDRLKLFMGGIEVSRLALNMDQIEEHEPPPNPAKITDSRSGAYIEAFGNDSWELDALEPALLADLVRKAVLKQRVAKLWAEAVAKQEKEREHLNKLAKRRMGK